MSVSVEDEATPQGTKSFGQILRTAVEYDCETARALRDNLPAIALGNFFVSVLLAAGLYNRGVDEWGLIWLVALWALTFARMFAGRYWGKFILEPDARGVRRWMAQYLVGTLAAGAIWGAAAYFFWNDRTDDFLVVALAGMVSGAVGTSLAYPPAFLAFAVPALAGLALPYLGADSLTAKLNAGMFAAFLVALSIVGVQLNRVFRLSIRLRTRNETLGSELNNARYEVGLAQDVLNNLSHELRTPLNAIGGFSQILASQLFGPLGDLRYTGYAKSIHDSSNHLISLVADIEDLSRLDMRKAEVEMSIVDLNDVIDKARRISVGRGDFEHAPIIAVLPENLPKVRSDPRRVTQILINLLTNACKFTPADGKITIRGGTDGDGSVRIAVEDTGIGMTEEEIPIALRRFGQVGRGHSRPRAGMGLGLPLVVVLADALGVEFDITSKAGVGTRAEIRFPAELMVRSEAD